VHKLTGLANTPVHGDNDAIAIESWAYGGTGGWWHGWCGGVVRVADEVPAEQQITIDMVKEFWVFCDAITAENEERRQRIWAPRERKTPRKRERWASRGWNNCRA